MKIAIFDPAQHVVGLKLLFEESDYYSISPNSFFKYQQRTNEDFHNVYKFNYKEDVFNLNDTNYDILIIVFVTYDGCFKKPEDACGADIMLEHIRSIINNNKFKNILYFDNYDYNYNPAPLLNIENKNITFFKRNYCYDVEYSSNTYSFPFMIFGQPQCILWTLLTENSYKSFNKDIVFGGETIFGALYDLSTIATIFKYDLSKAFPYLNAGVVIGRAGTIRELIDKYTQKEISDSVDDQILWRKIYLENKDKIAVDSKAKLVLNTCLTSKKNYVYEDNIFTYKGTNTQPSIIHAQGPEAFGFKEYLNYIKY